MASKLVNEFCISGEAFNSFIKFLVTSSVLLIGPPDLSRRRNSKPLVLPKPGTVGGAKISI